MATLQLSMPPRKHEHVTSPLPRRRVSYVTDSAATNSASRSRKGRAQSAQLVGILKKHSTASVTSSTATSGSSRRIDEDRDSSDGDTDDSSDYFPPLSAQLPPGPVATRTSRSKQLDVRRLPMPRKRLSSATSPLSPPPSPMSSRTGSSTRESLSFDMRPSITMDLAASALHVASSDRESMQQYRPSDLSSRDFKHTLLARDSLAVDSTESLTGSRVAGDTLPAFLHAARTGNLPALHRALQDPTTDVSQRDPVHGQTALHIAVRFGQFAAVQLLCQKSRHAQLLLDSRDHRENTPLHLAAAKSRRITKFLLEQGADVACANARGQTALGVHVLITRRDEPLVTEMLLQHGADPNAPLDASTLLHWAVDRGLVEVACRLVRHGARLDSKDVHARMVFDKVNRTLLRQLVSKITFPPVWVPDAERTACMLCARMFSRLGLGVRRHHCRHCGRLSCGQCSHVSVESARFPLAFDALGDTLATKKKTTKKSKKLERVCNTCSGVFKERETARAEEMTWPDDFVHKVVGYTWEEIESQQQPASRRSSVV